VSDMKINWLTDDGVNLPMINDIPRNLFYDKILSKNVRGKKCCDVGFGTGILSILALKHGATSIIAYEQDLDRFKLGQKIIDHLELTDQIELKHCRASCTEIKNTGSDVVLHEIIHQGIWGEGLWEIRPLHPGIKKYIPGNYFFELYATEISDVTVDGFLHGDNTTEFFNPGVEIKTDFVDLINSFILENNSKKIQPLSNDDYLIKLDWNKIHKDWSWNPGYVFKNYPKQLLCKYEVDYNTGKCSIIDSKGSKEIALESMSVCEMIVDTSHWKDKNMLLQPRFGLRHDQQRLYLDECRGWGAEVPWLFLKPKSSLLFVQNFKNPTYPPFQILKTNL